MTNSDTIQHLTETLLPLTLQVDEAGRELRDWRQNAGAKSKWSAHQGMNEHHLFKVFSDRTRELEEGLRPLIPEEWDMSHWGFRPARMADGIRWAAKGGKGHNGHTLDLEGSRLLFKMGAVAGLLAYHDTYFPPYQTRIQELGFTYGEVHQFSLSMHNCFAEQTAKTPISAYAAQLLKNPQHLWSSINSKMSPKEIFETGLEHARKEISFAPAWSLAPKLWADLRKDKTTRRLCSSAAPENHETRPIWHNHDLEIYDKTLAAANALLKIITPPKRGAKLEPFLLKRGQHLTPSLGWCGSSAILRLMVQTLDRKDCPKNFETWEAFAIADECGDAARRVTHDFFPDRD